MTGKLDSLYSYFSIYSQD